MSAVSLPACMGGRCALRDHCGRHVTDDRRFVVERLCDRGAEQPEPAQLAQFVLADMLADARPAQARVAA